MFCKKCGNQIADDMKFCTKCGTPVTLPKRTESQQPTVQPEAPVKEQEMADLPKEVWSSFEFEDPTLTHKPVKKSVETPKEYIGEKKETPKEYWQDYSKQNNNANNVVVPQDTFTDVSSKNVYPDVNQQQYSPPPQANYYNPVPDFQQVSNPVSQPDDFAPKATKSPKKKGGKNTGLKIIAVILVLAVLSVGCLLILDPIINRKQMEDKIYIEDFPVLKQEVEFKVYDEEKFPVEKYEIKVESMPTGGFLKSAAFINSKKPVIKEISDAKIYDLKFPEDGNYRITLTEIESSRTQLPVTTTTTTTTTTTVQEEDEPIEIVIDVEVDNDDPEAVDSVDINSQPGETTTAPTEESTTLPPPDEMIEASDADFKVFEDMVMKMMPETIPEFNYKTATAQFVTENLITHELGVSGYGYFYQDAYSKDVEEEGADPLNWWQVGSADGVDCYWVLNESNVKWICENIFHVKYVSKINSDFMYSKDGYIYKGFPNAGGSGYASITMDSYSKVQDKYGIVIEAVPEVDEQSVELYKFTADLQMIDGQKEWTIYSIEKLNEEPSTEPTTPTAPQQEPDIIATEEDFRTLADILLAINFTEFDSKSATTAYAVEYMLTNEAQSWGYDYFFKDLVKNPSNSDPLNKYGTGYKVMNAQNAKWICENILNIGFDPSYNSTKSYVHNGQIYRKSLIADERLNYFASLTSYKPVNKKYEITGEYYSAPIGVTTINDQSKLIGTYTVTAELKMIDGKAQWSIYSIKKSY